MDDSEGPPWLRKPPYGCLFQSCGFCIQWHRLLVSCGIHILEALLQLTLGPPCPWAPNIIPKCSVYGIGSTLVLFMILIFPNVRSYGYCYHHSSYCELSSFWWYCWVLLVESLLSFIHGENTQFMVIHLTIRLLRIRLGKWIDLHPFDGKNFWLSNR